MMTATSTLALAAADLLVEVDARGIMIEVVAIGAIGATVGAPFESLFESGDAAVAAAIGDLRPGRRSAPVPVSLVCGRRCEVTLIQIGGGDHVAAALRLADAAGGLVDRETLISAAAGAVSPGATLTLVEVGNMSAGLDRLPGDAAVALTARVEAALRDAALDHRSAASLGNDRFAVLTHRGDGATLVAELRRIANDDGVEVEPVLSEVAMPDRDQLLVASALRSALEGYIREGSGPDQDAVGARFAASLAATRNRAARFATIVRDKQVALVFQPIVELTTGAIHHHEVLARFGAQEDTEAMIRTAEELRMITRFDVAVASKAIDWLRSYEARPLKLAVNLSAVSLQSDDYPLALLAMTATRPDLRERLFLEVTETAMAGDMAATDRRIQALRGEGFRVYIDDFGSGAASLDYIRAFAVDAVKIDGRFVRDAARSARSAQMIRHIAGLCASLDLGVVAEHIETEAVRTVVASCGVGFGQGYLFGRPTKTPTRTTSAAPRRGVA